MNRWMLVTSHVLILSHRNSSSQTVQWHEVHFSRRRMSQCVPDHTEKCGSLFALTPRVKTWKWHTCFVNLEVNSSILRLLFWIWATYTNLQITFLILEMWNCVHIECCKHFLIFNDCAYLNTAYYINNTCRQERSICFVKESYLSVWQIIESYLCVNKPMLIESFVCFVGCGSSYIEKHNWESNCGGDWPNEWLASFLQKKQALCEFPNILSLEREFCFSEQCNDSSYLMF